MTTPTENFPMSAYETTLSQLDLCIVLLKSLLADAMQWQAYYQEQVEEAGEEPDPADVSGVELYQSRQQQLEEMIYQLSVWRDNQQQNTLSTGQS